MTCSAIIDYLKSPLLIVGDGNMSFGGTVVRKFPFLESVLVTTLEEQAVLVKKYPAAEEHIAAIRNAGGKVQFQVDATQLHRTTSSGLFATIVFNFPHVGGKSNLKKNRQLLEDFFASASQCIEHESGRIVISLCSGQGGTPAERAPRPQMADSWQIVEMAARSALGLVAVFPFSFPEYTHVGYRSQDKTFTRGEALTHVFAPCMILPVPQRLLHWQSVAPGLIIVAPNYVHINPRPHTTLQILQPLMRKSAWLESGHRKHQHLLVAVLKCDQDGEWEPDDTLMQRLETMLLGCCHDRSLQTFPSGWTCHLNVVAEYVEDLICSSPGSSGLALVRSCNSETLNLCWVSVGDQPSSKPARSVFQEFLQSPLTCEENPGPSGHVHSRLDWKIAPNTEPILRELQFATATSSKLYLECVNLNALESHLAPNVGLGAAAPPVLLQFPPLHEQDISFWLSSHFLECHWNDDDTTSFTTLIRQIVLCVVGRDTLKRCDLLEIYRNPSSNITPSRCVSACFRLGFQNERRVLSRRHVNEIMSRIRIALVQCLSVELR